MLESSFWQGLMSVDRNDVSIPDVLCDSHDGIFRFQEVTLRHYPGLILKFGPLIRLWTMRFESKLSYFKRCARQLKNFKNLSQSFRKTSDVSSLSFIWVNMGESEVQKISSAIAAVFPDLPVAVLNSVIDTLKALGAETTDDLQYITEGDLLPERERERERESSVLSSLNHLRIIFVLGKF
ncbi:hypothetical protein NFI96_028833 [Prochilodus magdalenae]|nr:hypothetical protein NFI96_028833 [Prochilodus magdalenae]